MDYEELRINEDNLPVELQEQHLKYSMAGNRHAMAAKRTRESKILLNELEAQLRDKIRAQLIEEGIRPTEGLLGERVQLEPEYKKLRRQVTALEYEEESAKAFRDAVRMRHDLLLQLCYFYGQEATNTYETMAKKLERGRRKSSSQ